MPCEARKGFTVVATSDPLRVLKQVLRLIYYLVAATSDPLRVLKHVSLHSTLLIALVAATGNPCRALKL
jgi:hypothetical protein